jgi:hypothetical protein
LNFLHWRIEIFQFITEKFGPEKCVLTEQYKLLHTNDEDEEKDDDNDNDDDNNNNNYYYYCSCRNE